MVVNLQSGHEKHGWKLPEMKILQLAGGHGGLLGPHVGPGQSPGGGPGGEAPGSSLILAIWNPIKQP